MHDERDLAPITVIIDADDTLWETQVLYSEAKDRFFEEMVNVGFLRQEVQSRFESIDHSNVSSLGFSKRRFPKSMRDTYQELCSKHATHFDEAMARQVQAIGATVFAASPIVLDGVRETLAKLRSRRVRNVLATKGDREVQEQRLEASGLRQYFDSVYILADKGVREFQQIVANEDIDVSSGWSVGNSAKSDINPALAVGLQAIWIPHETWSYEDEEPTANPKLHFARSITQVPDIVLRDR